MDAINDIGLEKIRARLSSTARIILPSSPDWTTGTSRWTEWCAPDLAVAVEVATENDVAETVRWANTINRPFLAVSGRHGGTLGLREMKDGVGILMQRLDKVELLEDGRSARVGGGVVSGKLLSRLWEMGKVAVAGCCETTGVVGPMLGGGHGFLQGMYGLMADQLISACVVTAAGDVVTASAKENEDLFWVLRGAGHNFAIVVSFEYRVYDRGPENETWSYEILAFAGEEQERVYEVANGIVGTEVGGKEAMHFTLMVNDPHLDSKRPVILCFLLYPGSSMPAIYNDPFLSLPRLSRAYGSTDYIGLPSVMGFSASQPACLPGKTWLRFPASAIHYDIPTMRTVYELFASFPTRLAKHSSVITEAYAMRGVQGVKAESTAVPDRHNNLILAAFVAYEPNEQEAEPDGEGVKLGKEVQRLIAKGSGGRLHAYVNYAFGDEGVDAWYGGQEWRLEKLRRLKGRWDPEDVFGWYCGIR